MRTLDALIPTRNRARLLTGAIESLLRARVPAGLTVNIAVIDNGSSDGTPQLLEWLAARYRGRIQIVEERRCGKSRALNASWKKEFPLGVPPSGSPGTNGDRSSRKPVHAGPSPLWMTPPPG